MDPAHSTFCVVGLLVETGCAGARVELVVIAVADRLDRYQYATLEYEPAHQFARPEVIDVFGHDNFGGKMTESRATPVRVSMLSNMAEIVVGTDRASEVTNGCRLATPRNDLLLVHAVADQLGSTTKCQRRLANQHAGYK